MGADLSQVSILARREIEARFLAPVIKALIQEWGRDEAMKFMEKIIQSIARESGAQMANLLRGNSLSHMAKGLPFWTKDDALRMDIREQTESRLVFNVTRCRYAEMYKELGIPELGALLSCHRDFAFLEGFNPKLKLTRTKTLMEGADLCDFCYSLKERRIENSAWR